MAVGSRRYSLIARIWAGVFLAVGLVFFVAPSATGNLLAALAQPFGLTGRITSSAPGLWFVLALSLMVAVTGLAWDSAARPGEPGPFRILVAAKLVSTTGFLALATRSGTIWFLPALADGFVALTLVWARRSDAR